MEVFVKILTFLLLAAGAFLVYGAKFIASRMIKTGTNIDNMDDKDLHQTEDNNLKSSNNAAEQPYNFMMEKQIVNIKITGTIFIIAGAILALVVFR